jgi:hypothetical protein
MNTPHKFAATVTRCDSNKFMKYPCFGQITVYEVFTDGKIKCAFQPGYFVDGKFQQTGCPVAMLRPEYIVN